MKLVHHSLWIRPVGLVEFPVTLHGPVEEIDDDLIDLDTFLLVLSCHGEHFLLGAVTELTLPQAHPVLREHRCASGNGRIIFHDLLRSVRNGQPVVHLFRGTGGPLGIILSEGGLADGRVVPEYTITKARYGKGNGNLGVSLGQLQHTALEIHVGLLILSHSEDLLAIVALEFYIQLILAAADDTLPLTVYNLQAAALFTEGSIVKTEILAKELLAVTIIGDDSAEVYHCLDAAISDGRNLFFIDGAVTNPVVLLADLNDCLTFFRCLYKSPVLIGKF